MTNWGRFLLAVWLIAGGLISLLHLGFSGRERLLALVAAAAGFCLLWERGRVSWRVRTDILLLGIWLLISGLSGLLSISFNGRKMVLGLLALAAGILLLWDRT